MDTLLITIGFLIFTTLVFFRREWGIYLIILLLPTYQIRFQLVGTPMTFLEGMILILATVVLINIVAESFSSPSSIRQVIQKRFGSLKASATTVFVFLFLLSATIAVFTAPDLEKAAGIWKAYFVEPIIFFFLIILIIDSPERLTRLFKSFAWLIIYLGTFGIFQFLSLANLPFSWWAVDVASRRITSLVNHPNALALLIGPPLSMLIIHMLANKAALKSKLYLAAGILGLVTLFLSFSRASWLAVIISIIFFGFFTRYKKLVLTGSLVVVLLVMAVPFAREKIVSLIAGRDLAQQNRIILWAAATDIIKNNPAFGVGLKGFREAYKDYPLGPDQVRQNYPHNLLLNFWVELGILGMASMLGLLILFYKKVWEIFKKNKSLALAIAAGMTVVLLHGMVDVPYFKNDLSLLFWALLALPYLNKKSLVIQSSDRTSSTR